MPRRREIFPPLHLLLFPEFIAFFFFKEKYQVRVVRGNGVSVIRKRYGL